MDRTKVGKRESNGKRSCIPRKQAKALTRLTDDAVWLAQLLGCGWTKDKCLRHLGLDTYFYRCCQATEEFQDLVRDEKKKFIQRQLEMKAEDPMRSEVQQIIPDAVRRAKKIIKKGEDNEANKAIKTILEVGVGKKDDKSSAVAAVQINISNDKMSHLDAIEAKMASRERENRKEE